MSEVYLIEFAEQCGRPRETFAGETAYDAEGNAMGWIVEGTVSDEPGAEAIQAAIDKLWSAMSAKARDAADADERMARYAYTEGLSLASLIAANGLGGQDAAEVARHMEADIQQLVRKYRYEEGTR